MKAIIKIVTAQKEFSKEDLDCFRRMLNVLHDHHLSARLDIKKKQVQSYKIVQSKLKTVWAKGKLSGIALMITIDYIKEKDLVNFIGGIAHSAAEHGKNYRIT